MVAAIERTKAGKAPAVHTPAQVKAILDAAREEVETAEKAVHDAANAAEQARFALHRAQGARDAVEKDLARRGLDEASDQLHEGGLAGSGCPDDADLLPGRNL